MKYYLSFLTICLLFSACVDEKDDETIVPVITAPKKAEIDTSSQTACELCKVDLQIIDLENKITYLGRDINRKNERLKLQARMDSLNAMFNSKIALFGGDANKAKQVCAKNYPIEFIKDTAERNKAIAEVFVWYYNTAFPSFDTTAYVPIIKNGKYEVQHKGKTFLMSESEHNNYLKSGLDFNAKVKSIYETEIRNAISKFTGLDKNKIDEICIYVIGGLSLNYRFHPEVEKIKASNEKYKNYMKIQTDFWSE